MRVEFEGKQYLSSGVINTIPNGLKSALSGRRWYFNQRWDVIGQTNLGDDLYAETQTRLMGYFQRYGSWYRIKFGAGNVVASSAVAKTEVVADDAKLESAVNAKFEQSRDDAIKASVKAAKAAVVEMLPVEHFIEVRTPAGKHQIEGRPHKKLNTLVQILNQRVHTMMVGPAGSGKTTAASQAAEVLELDYYEASMGPATSQWDLFGYRSPDGKYIPGVLRKPFEEGGVLALDELDNSNPNVLTALNSALSNGHCNFPDGMVMRHENFVCVGAGNTYGRGADRLYVGRNQLDAATLDRFAVVDWDYDEDAELDWAGRDQIEWVDWVQRVRRIAADHQMRVVISPRASINGAKLLRAGMERNEVAEIVLWKGMNADDRDRIEMQLR